MLDERTVNQLEELAKNVNPAIKEVEYSPITKFILIYDFHNNVYRLDTYNISKINLLVEFSKIVKEVK